MYKRKSPETATRKKTLCRCAFHLPFPQTSTSRSGRSPPTGLQVEDILFLREKDHPHNVCIVFFFPFLLAGGRVCSEI